MFQYAALLGIASQHGFIPLITMPTCLLDAFAIAMDSIPLDQMGKYDMKKEEMAGMFTEFTMTSGTENVYLYGYFQSWKYFQNIKSDLIQRHFKFKEQYTNLAFNFIKKSISDKNLVDPVVVGVHIRRGDFTRMQRMGLFPATAPFFYRAMNYYVNKYKNVLFVVCSNDLDWGYDHLDTEYYNIVFSRRENQMEDLAILSACDHSIISGGTFGWWSAYLTGGDVIYYGRFPDNSTTIGQQYVREDYYPTSWISM